MPSRKRTPRRGSWLLSLHVSTAEAAARLLLTVAAGAAIGFDRNKGGHPAGLGTTVLVCLAACLAMLEADLLTPTTGKTPESFASLDFMRLPLGILTGMGFLGAGAILRRGNHVAGLTTAATLWVTTVIGLCIGGGQLALGVAGTVLCIIVGVAAKRLETLMSQDHTANLFIEAAAEADVLPLVRAALRDQAFEIVGLAETVDRGGREYRLSLRWRSRERLATMPSAIADLMGRGAIRRVSWCPAAAPRPADD